ncbi:aminomethyl transferase family protein [Microbacterium sp. LRZ72]|uniref:aminomethyl transferase family protein n=1 Tax=Microbacterium sp. LRZ72 TaxID=2942481 RepID=UPI0029B29EB2|nr:aminomethyl transferase family protein [Microbacterium sp. LRZ72]MDX2377520.1 aminomethyl transferase family protein [Microbacterium sp. LRZ72]
MSVPTLQDAIDSAGSPMHLLWKPSAAPWTGPRVPAEFSGWAEEQAAWHRSVALFDLSFHMSDLFIEGADAVRLLGDVSANRYEPFAVGQAKQFVPVGPGGRIIGDGILLRTGEESFVLTGPRPAQNWVQYHAETGDYRVRLETDPDMGRRDGEDPRLCRFQLQGPRALEVVDRAFGGPLPAVKFFHSSEVELDGRPIRALRHGMAGAAGYEFIGDFADYDRFKSALLAAGRESALVQVGALAYSTTPVESGWIASPQPAIYLDEDLEDYRRWLSAFSFEGQRPIHGSWYSDDIEDYYLSPWELGYARSISFDNDFIGRDALRADGGDARRVKVTLEFDPTESRAVFGDGFFNDRGIHRVESDGRLVGVTHHISAIGDKHLGLALVDASVSRPGSRVELVWGEHPGPDASPDAALGFARLVGTVQTSPYDEYARTTYRSAIGA